MNGHLAFGLAALVLVPSLAAATHTTSGNGVNPDWIDATFTLALDRDLATLRVEARLEVHKVDGASAGNLRAGWQAQPAGFGASSGAVVAARQRIDSAFDATLVSLFPDATRTFNATAPVASTFDTGSTAAGSFDPGVEFVKTGVITLSAARTGLGYTADQVEAVLDAGARIGVEHQFRAEKGWSTTWRLRLPTGWSWTSFDSVGGSPTVLSSDSREATLVIDAVDASLAVVAGSPAKLQSKVGKAGAPRPSFSDERAEIRASVSGFRDGVQGLPIAATITAELFAIDVGSRFPDALAAKVDLPFLSASGMRRLKAVGVLGDDDVDTAVASVRDDAKSRLDGAFGGSTTVTARSDPGSLAPAATGPVRLLAFANTTKDLGDVEPAVARAALEGGAVVRLNLTLSGVKGVRTAYVVELPAGEMAFATGSSGELLAANRARIVVDGRNLTTVPPQAAAFRIHDPDATPPTAEDVDLGVVFDLKKLDTTLSGAIGGDLGNILIEVRAEAKITAIALPDAVKADLPPTVEIGFLSADTLRKLRAAGGLDDAALDDLDREFLSGVRSAVADVAGDAVVEGGLDRSTLTGTGPVVLRAKVSFAQSLSGAGAGGAAMVLTEVSQSFDLKSLQGRETTYRVILPEGIVLVKLDSPGATSSIGETDGRSSGEIVVPAGGSSTTVATLGVTPGLLWALFPEVVIGALVVVTLILGLVTWGIVKLVRRK